MATSPALRARPTPLKTRPALKTRFEARVSSEVKRQWEQAAALSGTTLSEFVIRSAQQAASETIREHNVLVLGPKASRELFDLLMSPPPKPNAYVVAAAKRYKRRLIQL
jgi:uncharacterized protein (DUF1778 family)